MNDETLNKPISLRNLSLALANVRADYRGWIDQIGTRINNIYEEMWESFVVNPTTQGTAGQVLSLDSNLNPTWSTPSSGVTYTLSISGNVITLTGSDGSTSSVTLPVYSGGVTT